MRMNNISSHSIKMNTPPRVIRKTEVHRLEDPHNMRRKKNNTRKTMARTAPVNERFIGKNKYGIPIPSKDPRVYEPDIHETALLLEYRPNGVYNYRKKAQQDMTTAVEKYNWERASASAKAMGQSQTQEGFTLGGKRRKTRKTHTSCKSTYKRRR